MKIIKLKYKRFYYIKCKLEVRRETYHFIFDKKRICDIYVACDISFGN